MCRIVCVVQRQVVLVHHLSFCYLVHEFFALRVQKGDIYRIAVIQNPGNIRQPFEHVAFAADGAFKMAEQPRVAQLARIRGLGYSANDMGGRLIFPAVAEVEYGQIGYLRVNAYARNAEVSGVRQRTLGQSVGGGNLQEAIVAPDNAVCVFVGARCQGTVPVLGVNLVSGIDGVVHRDQFAGVRLADGFRLFGRGRFPDVRIGGCERRFDSFGSLRGRARVLGYRSAVRSGRCPLRGRGVLYGRIFFDDSLNLFYDLYGFELAIRQQIPAYLRLRDGKFRQRNRPLYRRVQFFQIRRVV